MLTRPIGVQHPLLDAEGPRIRRERAVAAVAAVGVRAGVGRQIGMLDSDHLPDPGGQRQQGALECDALVVVPLDGGIRGYVWHAVIRNAAHDAADLLARARNGDAQTLRERGAPRRAHAQKSSGTPARP